MDTKPVLATLTGDVFQPVRLHYRVFDAKGLLQALQKLRCVDHDPDRQRWVWMYDDEAKGLKFQKSYAQLSKDLHPIVIGEFFLRTNDTLLLDLCSCERAIRAIPFFDKHIPLSVAKVMEAEVASKLYSTENPQLSPADIFDHQTSASRDPQAELQRLTELMTQGRSPQARLDIALKAMDSVARQPLPEIDRIPVHYYEDGIEGFKLGLTVRQIIAKERWSGNTAYTLSDAIEAVTRSM